MADHPRQKTFQLNIRVDPELGEEIDALAEADGRSRASWVERALRSLVAGARKKKFDKRLARG